MAPFSNWNPWYQAQNRQIYPFQRNYSYYQSPFRWCIFYPTRHTPLGMYAKHIRYDLRKAPHHGIQPTMYNQIEFQPAFAELTHHIYIISKAFPWMVEIRAPAGSMVTCGAVLTSLYDMLQKPIVDSEWGIIVHDRMKRAKIQRAARKRRRRDKDVRLKRIDWLGGNTVFKGLEQDKGFERKRLLPGMQGCEVWVAKLGKA